MIKSHVLYQLSYILGWRFTIPPNVSKGGSVMTLSRAYRYCPCASSFKGWLATITTMPCIHKGFVPAAHFCRRVLSQIPIFMTPLRHQSYFLEFTLMIRTGRNRTCILRIRRVAFPIKLPFLFCFLKGLQCPIKNRT